MAIVQENASTQAICPQCSTKVKAELKFCPVCGASLMREAASADAPVGPASAMSAAKPVPRRKGKLIIIAAVIIVIFLFVAKLNSPINQVKSGTLNDFGSQTIGDMVDDNFKKVSWTYEKLDGDSGFVYAEGYCVTFQQNLRLEFYYEKDSGEFLLKEIDWLDSGEIDTNLFSMALTLGMLYN